MRADRLRPLLHSTSTLVLLALLRSWDTLRALLLVGGLAAIVIETLRLTIPSVGAFLARAVPVYRPHELARPSGAAWLFVGYACAALLPPPAPGAAVLAGGLADPAAALVGSRLGGGQRKSRAGTAAAAVVTIGALLLLGIAPAVALGAALAAAALERWPGPFDDNLLIAPAVGLVVWWLA